KPYTPTRQNLERRRRIGMTSFIVTGAAGGVGAAAVRQLAARGSNVLAVDLDAAGLEQTRASASGGEVVTQAADVGDEDAVRSYVEDAASRFGSLDGVFNIAGVEGKFEFIGGGSTENFDNVMRINARSVFLNMKYVIPKLIENGGGAVVNVGSHLAWHG